MRYDMVILFAGIGLMILVIADYMPEDFLPWLSLQRQKIKEWKARR